MEVNMAKNIKNEKDVKKNFDVTTSKFEEFDTFITKKREFHILFNFFDKIDR
jgi:hypothetical protein